VYVVGLEDGDPYQSSAGVDWLFDTGTANAFMGSPVALDYGLNFNVDAVYIPETSGEISPWSWDGAMYKIAIPWWGTGDYGAVDTGQYSDDPLSGSNPWLFSKLVSSTGPISAPPALSTDGRKNVWVYFGTGRYVTDDDKTDTSQQYFYGIKDPFFNNDLYSATYYQSYASTATVSPAIDLLNGDLFSVVESGRVYTGGGATALYATLNLFIDYSRTKDGWYIPLGASGSGERSLSKAAVLGGMVLAPSFEPNNDICGFGGESYLYGLYFETGTAYSEAIFKNSTQTYSGDTNETEVLKKVQIGRGMAASAGIHIGKESGAKGLIQQSTGVITAIDLSPVFGIKSNVTSWQEN
jgi:type IV pilus assembly protein PilY1